MVKDEGAFLTIGELARDLGVAQHILRYWESRFPQLRPLQRSGNRRYYRPDDVELARRINRLLNEEGFTVKGAQRALADRDSLVGKAESGIGKEETGSLGAVSESMQSSAAQASTSSDRPPVSAETRLPIDHLSQKPGDGRVAASDFPSADVDALIARLTMIREDLEQAIKPD